MACCTNTRATKATAAWRTSFAPRVRTSRRAAANEPRLTAHRHVGWLALLIAQATLAARGQIAAHRKVGRFGIAHGVLVLAMGLVVSFAMPVINFHAGIWNADRAEQFLATPLGDMVLFGSFFGAAIAYRGKPEIHKRLIVLAAVAVMFAAVGRAITNAGMLAGDADAFTSRPLQLTLWYSPVIVAM